MSSKTTLIAATVGKVRKAAQPVDTTAAERQSNAAPIKFDSINYVHNRKRFPTADNKINLWKNYKWNRRLSEMQQLKISPFDTWPPSRSLWHSPTNFTLFEIYVFHV